MVLAKLCKEHKFLMCIEHKLYRVLTKWISGKLTFLPGKRRKFCLVLLILVEPAFCEMKQKEKKGKKEGKEKKINIRT